MFTFDPRIRGIPAQREQVMSLYESVNQPHLAIPGKQAGLARAYIVGLRGAAGFNVFVYLDLPQSGDCAVYLSERRNVSAQDFADEEAEALGFVESMGFIVDDLNYRAQPQPRQDEMLKTLAVFQREPRSTTAAGGKAAEASPLVQLGRLFGSF